jgi:ABC-type amino acid transport substrate-binding protein
MRVGRFTLSALRILAPVVAGALLATVVDRMAMARPLDDVIASGTLTAAVYRDNPPFSFRRGDELVGIDVDIARRIANDLGVALAPMEITADETVDDDLRNAVWKGHHLWHKVVADLMLSVPYDRALGQRNSLVALFAPYAEERFVLVGNPNHINVKRSLVALRGSRLGVEIDSLPDFYLSSVMNGVLRNSVVHFPTTEAAAHALADGTVSGVMATNSRLEGALGSQIEALDVEPVNFQGLGKESWILGIAVKEDSRDLGYAAADIIGELVQSGDMAAIYRAYGVTYQPPSM